MTPFFNKQLIQATERINTSLEASVYRLDKNEQSQDVQTFYKSKVLNHFLQQDWNRYPHTDLSDIENKVADYCGLERKNIVLSSGSANLITTLLNYFAINGKKIVLNQPSYSLFEYHCNTYNIPFTPWKLNNDLSFDVQNLPTLDDQSVLIITSPNNPTGHTLSKNHIKQILTQHPGTIVMLDAVYTEFSEEDLTPWVNEFDNLIVLRSFSKAFPIAGLRLGYLCAPECISSLVKKLILPFSIHPFTLCFAREVLFDTEFQIIAKQRVQNIIDEREKMKKVLLSTLPHRLLQVFPSQGNFLLIRIHDDVFFHKAMSAFQSVGIKVLNTSSVIQLENTFRVTIGDPQENEAVLRCLLNTLCIKSSLKNEASYPFIPYTPRLSEVACMMN